MTARSLYRKHRHNRHCRHKQKKGFDIYEKQNTRKDSNDSERQVHRYIRLTYLIPELLDKVDEVKVAFSPAVEISFLTEEEQKVLVDAMALNDCTPSHAQSLRLKKLSQEGLLDQNAIYEIMSEEKPNQQEQIKLKRDDLRKYFPPNYTNEQIKKDIVGNCYLQLIRGTN